MLLSATTIVSEVMIDDWYEVSQGLVQECVSWGGTATTFHRNQPDNLPPNGYTTATLQSYMTNYTLDDDINQYYYEMAWYIESFKIVESYIQLEDDIGNVIKIDETQDAGKKSKGYVDYLSERHYTKAVLFYSIDGQNKEMVFKIVPR